MGDEQIEIGALEPVPLKYPSADFAHFAHCVFEDRLAFLMDEMHLLLHGLVRRRIQAAARGHIKKFSARPVNFVQIIEDSEFLLRAWFEKHRSRGIAE